MPAFNSPAARTVRTRQAWRVPRAAYSLLELLVVIVILSVLLGLTIAAVQKVRAAGLRAERANWHYQRKLGENTPRKLPIRILFIGNSFTQVNDLPGTLKLLADASNEQTELVVDSHLVGGATLKQHWDDGVARQKIKDGNWDFVVLQEQSQTPLKQFGRDTLFFPYSRLFAEEIREAEAIPLFYMTWARPDTPGPQEWWTDSYARITKELAAECVPAGESIERIKPVLPQLTLFTDGNGHPTPAATYLIACTFFATIYQKTPEGLPAQLMNGVGVAPGDAPAVQKCAWETYRATRQRLKAHWQP